MSQCPKERFLKAKLALFSSTTQECISKQFISLKSKRCPSFIIVKGYLGFFLSLLKSEKNKQTWTHFRRPPVKGCLGKTVRKPLKNTPEKILHVR